MTKPITFAYAVGLILKRAVPQNDGKDIVLILGVEDAKEGKDAAYGKIVSRAMQQYPGYLLSVGETMAVEGTMR